MCFRAVDQLIQSISRLSKRRDQYSSAPERRDLAVEGSSWSGTQAQHVADMQRTYP